LTASDYFDSDYYGGQVRSLEGHVPDDLLGHYNVVGWRFGLDPHPEFSTNGYLAEHLDVWQEDANPLLHFDLWGRNENRKIISVAGYERWPQPKKIIRRVELFDLEYYRIQSRSEQFSNVLSALDHYLETGWRIGLDPHPTFSTNGYLHDNWDVAEDGIDPLTHFTHHGFFEGRPLVDPVAFARPGYRTPDSSWVRDLRKSLALYLRHLGIDFEASELELSGDIFVLEADLEWFDADFYLGLYDDVADAGVPALTHFILAGHQEGRFPNASIGAKLALRSDTERVLLAKSVLATPSNQVSINRRGVRTGADVISEIIDRQMIQSARVIIAFAHDDYAEHIGGIQIVSAREQAHFQELGDSYISVFPRRPMLGLSGSPTEDFLVQCRVNGVLLDESFPLVEFAHAFSEHFAEQSVIVVMHSVLGHSPEAIQQAVNLIDPLSAIWWIHDYTVHCQNYRLTRNGVNWCGDPSPESQSCQLCSYGAVRRQHTERIQSLFDGVDWVFAAPSDVAADQSVSGHTPLPQRPLVVPHGEIRYVGVKREPCRDNEKVRVAFVGHPATIKGWDRFIAFVSDAGLAAENFEFFHFGAKDQSVPGVMFVELRPEPGGRSVATQKLVEHKIDAVMNIVDGKETFNFVTFEAMAAGCCIITSDRSGNVIAAAARENLLIEVADDPESFDYLGMRDQIRSKRRIDVGEFHITGLTPSLLLMVNP